MKRIILVLTAALLLAAMSAAVAPAMAQEEKKEEEKKEEEKKDEEKKDEEKDLPKSGGLPINASLLGLGAGVLLVGGGLIAVRSARRDRR